MMIGLAVILILGVFAGLVFWLESRKSSLAQALRDLTEFDPTQELMGEDGNSGIAVDEHRRKLAFVRRSGQGSETNVFPYSDIITSEIVENGVAVSTVSRGGQLAGVAVGGLLLGGPGAIIGGLSGARSTKTKVHQIQLRVTVAHTADPVHSVNFLLTDCTKPGGVYDAVIKKAAKWQGIIQAALHEGSQSSSSAAPKASPELVTEKLVELAKLRDDGVLSEEEFHDLKRKLLAA